MNLIKNYTSVWLFTSTSKSINRETEKNQLILPSVIWTYSHDTQCTRSWSTVVEIIHTDIYMYSRDMNDIKYIPTL